MNLVIVESPTKARTLSRFLGDDYRIVASMGHIRDLPKSELAIDVKNDFKPRYIIPRGKAKQVKLLKTEAKDKEKVILATDPDREGEAIAYHIRYLLTKDKKELIHTIKMFFQNRDNAVRQQENQKRLKEKEGLNIDGNTHLRMFDIIKGIEINGRA